MRELTAIVIHGAWTPPGLDIGAAEIRDWHVNGNGWDDIGYHYVIRRDGTVEEGRPVREVGAHVAGHNASTIGVCLPGGKDVNPAWADYVTEQEFVAQELAWEANYSRFQWSSLEDLVRRLLDAWGGHLDVCGHRDYPGVVKRCPGFDVRAWWAAT